MSSLLLPCTLIDPAQCRRPTVHLRLASLNRNRDVKICCYSQQSLSYTMSSGIPHPCTLLPPLCLPPIPSHPLVTTIDRRHVCVMVQ
ncbi:hypothetical protein CALCODRAFT_297668 [Calocera cornea HHB12733]|uniref:Uncharacterized protein n=1 Tax=Calocera cornea HHB12733 TaxID=1353952 RepID=A0A165FM69_9BASI|nr:hypothetical protein CALCODRAFT_297668 [Calocera cornea HHB12733]